jgi:hypothetical protein
MFEKDGSVGMARKCKGSWLDNYIELTKEQESPLAFHHWVAMACISTALGRNIWLERGYYRIYPNIFVILVAGSAMCRKSTATGIGVNTILKRMKEPPLIFSQKITTEALIGALGGQTGDSTGLIYAPELSVFMGSDSIKSGLIPNLTDLYDSPDKWSYHTKGRGIEELKNVAISMLAASTMEWLRSSISNDAIGGGFTGRVVFVNEQSPSKPNLFPASINFNLREDLIDDLNSMHMSMKGEIHLSKAATDLALDWYQQHFFESRDPKVSGYYARKHDLMFKIAMLLSASESNALTIEVPYIERALLLLKAVELHLDDVAEAVSTSQSAGSGERILDIIRRHKKITHADLMRKSWRFANAQEMQVIIQTFLESRVIKESLDKDNRTRWYECI